MRKFTLLGLILGLVFNSFGQMKLDSSYWYSFEEGNDDSIFSYKYVYEVDSAGNIIEQYGYQNDELILESSITYDSLGNMFTYDFYWPTEGIMTSGAYIYNYNSEGMIITRVNKGSPDEVDSLALDTYYYNSNNILDSIVVIFPRRYDDISGDQADSVVWEYGRKEEYDINGDTTIKTTYHWDSGSNEWYVSVNVTSKSVTISDSLGNIKESRSYTYDSTGLGSWKINVVGFYYYSELIDSSTLTFIVEEENKFIVYPNPADDQIVISMDQDFSSLLVRNISGQIVKAEQVNSQKMNLDVSDIESGIYFIQLQGNENSVTKKIVIR